MITRIEVMNYRCLEKIGVDLSDFALLVGANGSGKTTLLDIPDLVGECLQEQYVGKAFTMARSGLPPRSSTLDELVFQNRGDHFSIALEVRLPDRIVKKLADALNAGDQQQAENWFRYIRYEIRFKITEKRELTIADEYLFLFTEKDKPDRVSNRLYGENPKKAWRVILKRSANEKSHLRSESQKSAKAKQIFVSSTLLALPKVKFEAESAHPSASWFYDFICHRSVFYQPDIKLLQTARPPGQPKGIMPDAANLPWLALDLAKEKKRFQLWVDHVQTALPQIQSIRIKVREEDHHAYFIVTYFGGYEVTSSGLSEGTLRIFALTILPYLNDLPSLIITEEPEIGVHPKAIEAIIQSLSSVYDSQVLVSSHSPIVLAQSNLDRILCSRISM